MIFVVALPVGFIVAIKSYYAKNLIGVKIIVLYKNMHLKLKRINAKLLFKSIILNFIQYIIIFKHTIIRKIFMHIE